MTSPRPFSVTVHPFESQCSKSCAYEFPSGDIAAENALVFIAGLGDGPQSVQYIQTIAAGLRSRSDLKYSVFEARMRSSYGLFGNSSLANDAADISDLVKYLRGIGKRRIVLMGHSTGCQDIIEYTNQTVHNTSPVEGYILQGPVSDRESIDSFALTSKDSKFPEYLKHAEGMIATGRANDFIPNDKLPSMFAGTPVSAYRYHSLVAKGQVYGDDDFFSSDLDNDYLERIWTRIDKPILVLHSAEDEFVPGHIDKASLTETWRKAGGKTISPLSDLIPNASHAVEQPEAQKWLAKRVEEFLESL